MEKLVTDVCKIAKNFNWSVGLEEVKTLIRHILSLILIN